MKKISKMVVIMLIITIMLVTFNTSIFGRPININNINNNRTMAGTNEITTIGSIIYSTITSIGIVLSVVVLAILGVKYMLGSVEERAEYKKSMMPYLIGAVLVFSASTIATAIYNLAK